MRCWALHSFAIELLLLALLSSVSTSVWAQDDIHELLDFELPVMNGLPGGWGGGPPGTLFVDHSQFKTGSAAGRIERGEKSSGEFSTFTYRIPVDFEGNAIRYTGYLRSEAVSGWGGLWMRVDGDSGALAFDNMQDRAVSGDSGWAEYEILLDLPAGAKEIYFGALMAGSGRLWVDALSIELDEVPIAQVERIEVEPTVLDLEHEFDEGSGITIQELNEWQIENLVLLGRIWGFLKYHHPTVVQGQRHWDYALFRVMARMIDAQHEAARQVFLEDWILSLGEIEPCLECASYRKDAHLQPQLKWLHDEVALGTELATMLGNIRRHRPALEKQFYVESVSQVGNPIFLHELRYEQFADPDTGYRLLALFRFWNIIEYWFPYRDLIEEDWVGVLKEFVPRMVRAADGEAYRLEMMQLIARVHDTHANLWSDLDLRPPSGECSVPTRLRFLEERCVVVDTDDFPPDEELALLPGDEILSVDGRSVEELIREYTPFYAASNPPSRLRGMAAQLLRGNCEAVSLGVRRGDEEFEITASRIPITQTPRRWHDRPGEAFQMLGEDVAYLKLSTVEIAQIPSYLEAAKGTKGWVLDLRNYPAEFVVFALGQHFVKKPTEFVRFTVADLDSPGTFEWGEPLALTPVEPYYDGKLVILVDEVTQSSAEYTSMAFRAAPNAVVIGSTTAGADGNVSAISLPGGLRTMISGIGVFYPDQRGTQRVGIALDLEKVPTVEGIRDGRDELLEEALRQILGEEMTDQSIQDLLRP